MVSVHDRETEREGLDLEALDRYIDILIIIIINVSARMNE